MIRVLSIDGGGMRGIIPAMVLNHIEQRTGKAISENFDLIAGASTGGIAALLLTLPGHTKKPKYTADELFDLYKELGGQIFSRSLWGNITGLWGFAGPKYSSTALESLLKKYLGDAILGDCLTKVITNAYDLHAREPFFFKSWKPESENILMTDTALAISAAPTYFQPKFLVHNERRLGLIDGGVSLNNPTMSGYAEALRENCDENDFLVVSLGTGELTRPIPYQSAKSWGKIGWASSILSIIFDGVSDIVDYQMKLVDPKHYFRITTRLDHACDDLDDASPTNITALVRDATLMMKAHQKDLDEICDILSHFGETPTRAARRNATEEAAVMA